MAWLPVSYSFANFSVLAVGVWAIAQRDSIDAVLMVGHDVVLICFKSKMRLSYCSVYF